MPAFLRINDAALHRVVELTEHLALGFGAPRRGLSGKGSPAAIAITAPFPGAAIEPVSSMHSVPRAAFGVAMLTLLRVPSLEGDAPLAHA